MNVGLSYKKGDRMSGDEVALELGAEWKEAFEYAKNILNLRGGSWRSNADEILNDAMLLAMKGWRKEGGASPKTFIIRALKFVQTRRLAYAGRGCRSQFLTDSLQDTFGYTDDMDAQKLEDVIGDKYHAPDATAIRNECEGFWKRFVDIINTLPPGLETVLDLRYVHGKTLLEVGEILGVTLQAIALREKKAFKILQYSHGKELREFLVLFEKRDE
jgi:RNA polymerase sigma factor (sigma-70 family)